MRSQRGTALIETVVVGFAIVLMALPAFSTVARLSEAQSMVHGAARDSAVWVARHGGPPPRVEGVDVSVVEGLDQVEVTATQNVALIGVGGAVLSRTVRSRVEVALSDYRSSR